MASSVVFARMVERDVTKEGEVTITDVGKVRGANVDKYVGKWI